MTYLFAFGWLDFWEPLCVLAIGTGVLACMVSLVQPFLTSALWQRTLSQISFLALIGLILAETTGVGSFVTCWATGKRKAPLTGLSSHSEVADADPSSRKIPRTPDGRTSNVGEADVGEMRHQSKVSFSFKIVVAVWLLGLVFCLARTCFVHLLLLRFRVQSKPIYDLAVKSQISWLSRRLKLQRQIFVYESSRVRSPVAFGWVQPTIVLPVGFQSDFEPQQQDVILLHELAHLAAMDPLWKFIAQISMAIVWWHPAAWWLRHRLETTSESAADESSVLIPGGPEVLAECLVKVGRRLTPSWYAWLGVSGTPCRSLLGRRIQRLLILSSNKRHPPNQTWMALALIGMPILFMLPVLPLTTWARRSVPTADSNSPDQISFDSFWERSIAAAALERLNPLKPFANSSKSETSVDPPETANSTSHGFRANQGSTGSSDDRSRQHSDGMRLRDQPSPPSAKYSGERFNMQDRFRKIQRQLRKRHWRYTRPPKREAAPADQLQLEWHRQWHFYRQPVPQWQLPGISRQLIYWMSISPVTSQTTGMPSNASGSLSAMLVSET